MAIWQFDLFIVPREGTLPCLSEDSWTLPLMPADSTLAAQRGLVESIGCPWLMMDDWVVFGLENGTRVDLLFDNADEVEVQVRLDALASEAQIDAVCSFAIALDSQFFDPEARSFIRPDRNSLASALNASRAADFSIQPLAYLSRL